MNPRTRLVEELFREKWLHIRCNPIDATLPEYEAMAEEWDRWLDGCGVKRLNMSEVEKYSQLYRGEPTGEGGFLVINPASRFYEAERVLLIPKDVAEKLLFLGLP